MQGKSDQFGMPPPGPQREVVQVAGNHSLRSDLDAVAAAVRGVAGARYGMNSPGLAIPDVLVLGGGGILGEAWMTAVLAGLEETSGFDPRGCEGYVGTSAGSIVAAALVAGVRSAHTSRESARAAAHGEHGSA